MKYLNIALIKKHLNIDLDFTDDDELLEIIGNSAEMSVENYVDKSLDTYVDESGVLPSPLISAMLLHCGDLYMVRENISVGSLSEIPNTSKYLIAPYKNYITYRP